MDMNNSTKRTILALCAVTCAGVAEADVAFTAWTVPRASGLTAEVVYCSLLPIVKRHGNCWYVQTIAMHFRQTIDRKSVV